MKDRDVLLRAEEVLNDLYNKINTEEWCYDESVYENQMRDFFVITNLLSELIKYRYNKSITKEELKSFADGLIDKIH